MGLTSMSSDHKNRLPEGATETTLSFDQPGYIHITITPPGVAQKINLEEVVSKLKCDAYNQGTIMEWQRVFARLADLCRQQLPLTSYPPVHPASGHAPNCGLWYGGACSCEGRRV
jgi:hypothetical protein